MFEKNSTKYLTSSLFLTTIALLGIGLVQVYSSSFIFAIESYGDGLFFFKRQLFFAFLSFFVLIATIHFPLKYIEKYGWMLWSFSTLLIMLTFVPGIGVRVGGAIRWLQLPFGIRFEPAELLKISFSILFASLICRQDNLLDRLKWYWILPMLAMPFFFLLKQPDFGSFAIIILVCLGLLFAFGLQWRFIIAGISIMIPAFYFLVMNVPYRRARVLAFLDPWSDPDQKGFQVIQSMLSFHSGGLTGVGLGKGQGKLFFLPEAHTDFTLAVFGEEMGFVGFLILMSLYGFVVFRGIQVGLRAEKIFHRAMVIGLTMTFALSVFINSGVVMGLLPTKGLTLPFLSYGGSSIVMLSFLFGLILNVENKTQHDQFKRRFRFNQ